jgi:pimeloyl-ACP methyl ester carboxylesterase
VKSFAPVFLAACVALAPACAYFTKPLVGVRRIGTEQVALQLESSALTGDAPSATAKLALHYYDLADAFDQHPQAALVTLHERVTADTTRVFVYSLAELSFYVAEKLHSREHYLAAAIYAYDYLLDDERGDAPNPYDRTFRWACEIYNRGLREALMSDDRTELTIVDRRWQLPVGSIDVTLQSTDPALSRGSKLIPTDEYEVWGLSMRVRDSGLGVPLVASTSAGKESRRGRPAYVPCSAFLRLSGGLRELEQGRAAVLELRSAYESQGIAVGSHMVPLEADFSAALAVGLHQSTMWGKSLSTFFDGSKKEETNGLKMIRPYDRGSIPVVFVHGTASNPGNWAEMFNVLMSDSTLREHCQFWFYQYSTGNPILMSAQDLRTSLQKVVAEVDPNGSDAALKHMVLVGHSQGGLLCQLQVVDGDVSWWQELTGTPLADSGFSPEITELVRSAVVFDPLPFVDRVVYLSTPHRGSDLANHWLSRWINGLISVPSQVVSLSKAMQKDERFRRVMKQGVPTSINGMTPSSPFVRVLNGAEIAPGVVQNSIIAIGDGDPKHPEGASDGLVEYESAHIDGAESEVCVAGGHSCQGSSSAIREVRRILREHVARVGTVSRTP